MITIRRSARAVAAILTCVSLSGCALCDYFAGDPTPTASSSSAAPTDGPTIGPTDEPTESPSASPSGPPSSPQPEPTTTTIIDNPYPWHTKIVATTFWVGEIFDATADDGSQVISTYDSNWLTNYGGCDGVSTSGSCSTEKRTATDDYFPTSMTPKQNPFYLDLPFDDVNDSAAFARRGDLIPWANLAPYANDVGDASVSLMKNRWVELRLGDRRCFGQIEDAGPGEYDDAAYVFGMTDARPKNSRYGGAGLDVSPALNGCLDFAELDGDSDTVDWRFIEQGAVPDGPWNRIVTTSGVE